ncbi:MAG: 6,7-dimethyl-8-ribityllumazine synthase [Bacteroidales bacterium]|nr:6,7-dimethyl-8-ribityllumazine synthase [Bacteroidales bacterium]
MATANHNLSDYDSNLVPDASTMRVGVVISEWNYQVTGKLLDGAINTLKKHGVKDENIFIEHVPGSFELPFGAKCIANHYKPDAVILLGSVVRGDTPHFDYVCDGVTQGCMHLNTQYDIPFIFGLLTTDNLKQAEDRAGGMHGNKGDEAAVTAIKMVDLAWRLKK